MATLELSAGNSLAFDYQEPKDGGKTFVCFNALSGDMTMWTASVGEALKANGHGWLIYNLRGQAGSSYTIAAFNETQIVADAMALLEHVSPRNPIHVGLSIGGLFAIRAHLAGGAGAAQGLVLLNTLRKSGARLDWVNDAVVRMAETGGMGLLKDLYSPLLMNEEWQAANRADFLGEPAYAPCAANDPALLLLKSGPSADWNIRYEDITVPTLIVTGLQDRVFFNAEHVDELTARFSNAERIDMANSGHMIPVERPQELSVALIAFAKNLA